MLAYLDCMSPKSSSIFVASLKTQEYSRPMQDKSTILNLSKKKNPQMAWKCLEWQAKGRFGRRSVGLHKTVLAGKFRFQA